MSDFDHTIDKHMTQAVVTISVDDEIQSAEALLRQHGISSLPVVGRDGDLAGVISFRDLLSAGHVLGRMMGARTVLTLPSGCVGDLMTPKPMVVTPDQTVREAAQQMVTHRVHRVYVVRGHALVGVLSTNDVLRSVASSDIADPIVKFASSPVKHVNATATLFHAVEQLASGNVSGLVVVEDGLPIGLFTQVEALAVRDMPAETKVGQVVELSIMGLPWRTPLNRAAALAAHGRARRVLAMDGTEMRGILTALDFVRAGCA